MATRANVTSVEAIEAFRNKLLLFLEKAKPTVEEIHGEVTRTRSWVRDTQRVHWEGVFKRSQQELEEANAAVLSARMSTMREVSAAEQMRMARAKRGIAVAEEKLKVLRRWDRDFENRTDPSIKQLDKLHGVLTDELTKAVMYLNKMIVTLRNYHSLLSPSVNDVLKPLAIVPNPEVSKETLAAVPAEETKTKEPA